MITPKISYIICTNPRSGSWLLGDGLASTGIAGIPREWFSMEAQGANETNLSRRRWGILPPCESRTYKEFVDNVLQYGTTPNGVLGIKCHQEQFELLPNKFRTIPAYAHVPLREIIPAVFPNLRYVWLYRHDKIRQAISYIRASKTNIWRIENKNDAANAVRMTPPPITYDDNEIDNYVEAFLRRDLFFQHYFDMVGVKPIRVCYEDLSENYEATIRKLLIALEIQEAKEVTIPPPPYIKLADKANDEWAMRYASHKGEWVLRMLEEHSPFE